MLRIIQRYLAVNFIFPFMASAIFFVVFLLIFQMFRIMPIIINKDVNLAEVFSLVANISFSFLPMAIPLSCLFAALFSFNKMSEDSEIVAIRSFGIGKNQIIVPLFIVGCAISIGIFFLNTELIPQSKSSFKNTVIRLTSSGMLTSIRSGQFFTEIPNITLFAEKVSDDSTLLENVFIHGISKNDSLEQIISAKKGTLIKHNMNNAGFGVPAVRLHLAEGNIVKVDSEGKEIQKIIFEEYDFPIISSANQPELVNKFSMRTSRELSKLRKRDKNRLETLEDQERKNKISSEEKSELNFLKKNLAELELEYWSRLNTPIQCLLFIFLGISLGIKQGRGGTGRNSVGLALTVLILYYIIFFSGVSFANKGAIPSSLAVILPSILVLFVGIYYYRKLDWNS